MLEKSKVAVDESSNMDYRNDSASGMVSLPPAYDKPVPTSLKITRMVSMTLIAVTVIVGIMVVLGVYVHHANKCHCNAEDQDMSSSLLRPVASARIDRMDSDNAEERSGKLSDDNPKKLPVPVKLELDSTLGSLMKNPKNKKAQVNCVIENRKASQFISEDPKTLMTPFGNFSSDPKLVHLTGEKMIFSCFTAVEQGKNKSSKSKKLKALIQRPRRSVSDTCDCNCAC